MKWRGRQCFNCAMPATGRDHIIPKAWAGRDQMWWDDTGTVRNLRPACRNCNQGRGEVGHCVGALAALRAIPYPERERVEIEMRRVARLIEPPRWLWWQRVA